MKTTTLIIFGNIDFKDDVCSIHRIDNVMMLPESIAEDVAEQLCNSYDGYVIPELYAGDIVFDKYDQNNNE